jgi:hypothetical protein
MDAPPAGLVHEAGKPTQARDLPVSGAEARMCLSYRRKRGFRDSTVAVLLEPACDGAVTRLAFLR